ncbi:MAG: hypothetical protein VR65_06655 [Desulfobulbaceae bacterium BRH_c16a]|nr:MAG: hypothetical protein VR65_06655 [Desulfobulbaceae bacterium BRH_c16a]
MDDELELDDALNLIRCFINYSLNKQGRCGNRQEPVPPAICESPVIMERPTTREKPVTGGRLCFVISRSKSSSWVEDLADCLSIEERTRIYN